MKDNVQERHARNKSSSPNTGQQTMVMRNTEQRIEEAGRDATLVEDAALIRMMGMPVLEAVPLPRAPYKLTDLFILVHEGWFHLSEMAGKDTRHPPSMSHTTR